MGATTDGVHDLYFITFCQQVGSMPAAWDDFVVDFDRNPFVGQSQGFDQLCQGTGFLKLACFTVDPDVHAGVLADDIDQCVHR